KAQGCDEGATLGGRRKKFSLPQRGCGQFGRHDLAATPLALIPFFWRAPRVGAARQPWASSRNPFGIDHASKKLGSAPACSAFRNFPALSTPGEHFRKRSVFRGSIFFRSTSNPGSMRDQSILDNVRIASPCHARWEDMVGNDRARFCGQCRKNVYNFSAM